MSELSQNTSAGRWSLNQAGEFDAGDKRVLIVNAVGDVLLDIPHNAASVAPVIELQALVEAHNREISGD